MSFLNSKNLIYLSPIHQRHHVRLMDYPWVDSAIRGWIAEETPLNLFLQASPKKFKMSKIKILDFSLS